MSEYKIIAFDPASPKGDRSCKIEGFYKNGIFTITKVLYDIKTPEKPTLSIEKIGEN